MNAVRTSLGPVVGQAEADGAHTFRGIPYAKPPVGDLRFRPPQPHDGWTDPKDATTFGAIAHQNLGLLAVMFGGTPPAQSEDCLTLNVYTPAIDDRPRPVMVWIHGGGYLTGGSGTDWYDGRSFVANDVVLVTVNYRLGVLGFGHFGDLGGDRFTGSGNLGLLDQTAALRWVRDNIASFGGNPDDVTIFGESAGGSSVLALLCLEEAKGLAHRAIAQSASFTQYRNRDEGNDAAERFLSAAGLTPSDVAQLATMPAEQLLAAQATLEQRKDWPKAFSPTADGVVFDDTITQLLTAGRQAPVPLLIGTTADEMRMFTAFDPANVTMTEAGVLDFARAEVGDDIAQRLVPTYRAAYPDFTWGQIASALATEHSFRLPSIATAEQWISNTPVWMYRFDWKSPSFGGVLGACHALEIPFVFNTLTATGVGLLTGDGEDRAKVAETMHRDWIAFGRGETLDWPAYEPGTRATRLYGADTWVANDPDGELRELWNDRPTGA